MVNRQKPLIGLDARMSDHPGIGRYIRELCRALLEVNKNGQPFCFLGDSKIYDRLGLSAYASKTQTRETKSEIYSLGEQVEIPLKARGFSLLHVPHFNIPIFYSGRLVVTVHDLIYLHETGAAKNKAASLMTRFYLKQVCKKAAAILTVSEYTKNDLLNSFPGLSPERVHVTYEAASGAFWPLDKSDPVLAAASQKFSLKKPMILYVGALRPHKNVTTLIQAVENLNATKQTEAMLVLAGKSGTWDATLLRKIQASPFINYLGAVSDEELRALYNLADVFVFPSLREGFGLPVLEAMACGTPVISSNRSSLPEIVGDAGLLFDPTRVDALEELLYNVLKNNELQNKMRANGIEQAKKFSWANTASRTEEVYDKVLG